MACRNAGPEASAQVLVSRSCRQCRTKRSFVEVGSQADLGNQRDMPGAVAMHFFRLTLAHCLGPFLGARTKIVTYTGVSSSD
jgi:hypothetical protein